MSFWSALVLAIAIFAASRYVEAALNNIARGLLAIANSNRNKG